MQSEKTSGGLCRSHRQREKRIIGSNRKRCSDRKVKNALSITARLSVMAINVILKKDILNSHSWRYNIVNQF